ncbi:hypothetical protein CTU88_05190 [Streptomyces sp. JV178]|jgi:hypothetical protein|uniref:hypothetical protein n=1 Tax=Streptomyces sp. JV178 TaxID=858632 RepID=UPI000C1B4011|nr:hypothetical protein [Streptomyces sp. JV178]PIM73194.1 hypothetical protein CTU88_05190 [Streptomyces sp. JV178]
MVMTESTGATRSSTPLPLRVAWGVLAAFLLLWDVFEVVKHMGWVIPGAALGSVLPFLPRLTGLGRTPEPGRLAPRAVPLHNLLNLALIPFGIMVLFTFLGDAPEDIAAPFTFGMSWLTSIAFARALGFGLRTPEGWQR